MAHEFLVVAGSVATLFLMMAVGFFFAKRGMLGEQALSQMSSLLLKVVAPCVVIGALQVEFSAELLKTLGAALAVLVGLYVLYGVLVHFLFRKQPRQTGDPLRFGVMFGNIGFMGLPLIRAVLGEEALVFCTVALAVFNVANWTYGVVLMGERVSLKKAVVNPGVIGTAIAVTLFLLRLRLPGPLLSAVNYLGDLNTPLAMVVIGGQMASADLLATFRERRLYLATAIKLAALPLLTLAVLLPLGLEPLLTLTVVILAACPTAGVTSMFSQMFHKDTALSAQLVTLSTLLSVVTLPLITLLARRLAG